MIFDLWYSNILYFFQEEYKCEVGEKCNEVENFIH